jgi:adenine-specific DNA-methyltransferase
MADIKSLLSQIPDAILRGRLEEEFVRLNKNKKFGLVFEEHKPEFTPLYNVPVKKGGTVAVKTGNIEDIYTVLSVRNDCAKCIRKSDSEMVELPLTSLVTIARFGEPIFPTLEHIDEVENAPKSDIWHTIIEADNYHALQLLEYLYPKQVDCIYIDPPYNTGAKDWKYNNNYVDGNDSWRHSKWLSMMKKRLLLAKRILNPSTGVLIVTIDEHEIHHLRTLLEEIFIQSYIQMATIVINQKGVSQGRLARTEEYAIYVFMPNAFLPVYHDDYLSLDESIQTQKAPRWERLLRGGTDSQREDSPTLFYPVFVDPDNKKIIGVGEIMPLGQNPDLTKYPDKTVAWPIRKDGSYGRWQASPSTFMELVKQGFARLGTYDKKRGTWTVLYLNRGTRKRIDDGEIIITGRDSITGVVSVEFTNPEARMRNIKTVWHRKLHDSGVYGSSVLSTIVGRSINFDFPKSIYSTKDAIAAVVRNNKNALILDFFAGSGTTLNAVNLLNAEDKGTRRCILVTNNEVSASETAQLKKDGFQPGDPEWESHGICRSVTWPRTLNSIVGKHSDGTPLDGEYFTNQTVSKEVSRTVKQLHFDGSSLQLSAKKEMAALIGKLPQNLVKQDSGFVISEKHPVSILFDTSKSEEWLSSLEEQDHITEFYIVTLENRVFNDIKTKICNTLGNITVSESVKRPMKDGFSANVEYFKLGFLDRANVSLGKQFNEILPLLWLKSGAKGKRPFNDSDTEPNMLILPDNDFAVLNDEDMFASFIKKVEKQTKISNIYFVTNSEAAFREMSEAVPNMQTFQLYRDYIDNFVLGARREY